MLDSRTRRFRAALDVLGVSQAHRLLGEITRGAGIVLTMHHVRPWDGRDFAPNRLLEITPDFLETVLSHLVELDYDLVSLDEAVDRIQYGGERRFAAFTFDDGYRDVRDHALPIMRLYNAPSALLISPAFADGAGELWWLELEEALARLPEMEFAGEIFDLSTTPKKYEAWHKVYWRLRQMGEHEMRGAIGNLVHHAGLDMSSVSGKLCLNWDELREVARDPLVTIGNHTVSHYMLAKHPESVVRGEISHAQARIARELNVVPRHLVYPVGDPTSAGPREFRIAREMGFASAWTTRLGVLFPEHRDHMTALPRISLNGNYQNRKYAELFVSGLPFALSNAFGRLNVR